MSNKASALEISLSSRAISVSSCAISLSSSCVRLSLSRLLICASTVGCQFNLAKKRRHGGKEARNSDLLINGKSQDSEEIDMAVGRQEGDQDDQQTRQQGGDAAAIEQRTRIG